MEIQKYIAELKFRILECSNNLLVNGEIENIEDFESTNKLLFKRSEERFILYLLEGNQNLTLNEIEIILTYLELYETHQMEGYTPIEIIYKEIISLEV